jgi:sec-independent protein translocase protein TatB
VFEVGFTELLLIFALALVVLGPERLPRVASQVGRWIGRARAMARQFREQLEDEARLDETFTLEDPPRRRAKKKPPTPPPPPAPPPPDITPAAPASIEQPSAPTENFVPGDDDFRHNDTPEPPDERGN